MACLCLSLCACALSGFSATARKHKSIMVQAALVWPLDELARWFFGPFNSRLSKLLVASRLVACARVIVRIVAQEAQSAIVRRKNKSVHT